jgi:hypothetical protein
MRHSLLTGFACAALVLGLTPAVAQSTMSMPSPAEAGSGPAEAAAAPEAAAPKPKPNQKGPPRAVTVVNASTKAVTEVAITVGDKIASLSKPLAPKARTAVKLPKMKGCTVSVAATFEGGGKSDADAFNPDSPDRWSIRVRSWAE